MSFWFFKKKEDVHKKVGILEKNISDSFLNLRKDMGKVGFWIDHFKQKHSHHDQRLNTIEHKLEKVLAILKENEIEYEEPIEHVQSFKRSDASFMNIQSPKDLSNLTPAQKQVLMLMAFSGGPLDYNSISQKLKLNLVTVRRHMSDLKRAGIPLTEKVSVKNRRKIFILNKEVRDIIVGKRVSKIVNDNENTKKA